jgi:epoxyqueuosine reductase
LNLKKEVVNYAKEHLEMDYVGVASVDRFKNAPEGYRPTDILPGARSVVVMAVKLSQGSVQTVFRAYEDKLRHLQCIYGSYAYSLYPNFSLKFAAYSLARFLERNGQMATAVPSGPGSAGVPFSNRHAAVAAGIGEFGWLSIVMTPDYGPRIRIVSVITRADLEPDPMMPGGTLCDPKKCGICIKICPTHAISETRSKTVEMGGKTLTYGWVDFPRCMIGTQALTTKTFGYKDFNFSENPTMEEIGKATADLDPRQRFEVIGTSNAYHCGKCLAYCPVGGAWIKTVSKLDTASL